MTADRDSKPTAMIIRRIIKDKVTTSVNPRGCWLGLDMNPGIRMGLWIGRCVTTGSIQAGCGRMNAGRGGFHE
jgi:hypothetical protein